MRWVSNGARRLTLGAVCLFLSAGLLRLAPFHLDAGRSGAPLAAATPAIYVGILAGWIVSLNVRILSRDIRRPLIASAWLMILYMLLRTAKYQFFSTQDAVLRHLWYAYYIPMTAIPLLQLLAALRIGTREGRPIDPRWRWLFVPAALLILGILTNDLHQLAFRFRPGFVDWNHQYTRGALYIAAAGWMALLLLSALAVIAHRCRVAKSRRGLWMPFAALFIGALYMVWGLTEHFVTAIKIFQMPEVYCFMVVAFWELCIRAGLIPSNIGHADFFGVSTVAAQIVDARGAVLYRSQNAPPLAPAQMAAAADAPVPIDADTRLCSHPIRAGRIYWTDDLSTVRALNVRLSEIGEALAEENELIQVENRAKRQQARLSEKNRLYDGIARAVSPQLERIDGLLEGLEPGADDFARRVGHACVLNAYIKRRSNLMLIAEGENSVNAAEIGHCIRESVDCLTACGALCSLRCDARGEIFAGRAAMAYDFFEAAVEAALPGMTALLIDLTAADGELVLRLSMEDASARLPADWRRDALAALDGRISADESGATAHAALRFANGGALA